MARTPVLVALCLYVAAACATKSPVVADSQIGQYNFDEFLTLQQRLRDCFADLPYTTCPERSLRILYDGKVKEDLPAAVAECLKMNWGETKEQAQLIYQCAVNEMAKPLEPSRIGLYAYYEVDAIERRVYDCFQALPIDSKAATCIDLTRPSITAKNTKGTTGIVISKCLDTYPLELSKYQEIAACLEISLSKGFDEATNLDPLYDEDQIELIDSRTKLCEKKVRFTTTSSFSNPASHCTMSSYLRIVNNGAAKNLVPSFYASCLEGQNGARTVILNIEETRQCLINEMSKDV